MGETSRRLTPPEEAADLGRRRFLRKVALVGGAAWTVPTIITMAPASAAELTSPPPEPPGPPPPEVGGSEVARPPVGVQGVTQTPAAPQVGGRTELPRTGAELDQIAVAGLAATAGGAALVLWSADAEK